MSDCRNPEGRWPPLEIMRRAKEVDDTGLIPFVDTDAAARYLALSPHSLECYRSLGGGPPFYKFGKFVRYAVQDLEGWAAERKHERTAGEKLHDRTGLRGSGSSSVGLTIELFHNLVVLAATVRSSPARIVGYCAVASALRLSSRPLAAWVYALFQDVSDSDGDPERVFSMDAMLDDIMLYWLPNTGASSARLYWEGLQEIMKSGMPTAPMPTPTGISMFRREQIRLSRRWAERRFAKLVHFNELDKGGHFAALEQPKAFADEVRETFRSLR